MADPKDFKLQGRKRASLDPSIKQAITNFVNKYNLDPAKTVIISGGAMYAHGLRDKINDIDLMHPDLPDFFIEQEGGYEMDVGPGGDIPEDAYESELIDGVNVQTLPAMLKFYKAMNRPKDRKCIQMLEKLLAVSLLKNDRH